MPQPPPRPRRTARTAPPGWADDGGHGAGFGPRRTGTAGMPDPERLARNLALCAVEILDGVRPVEQLAAWISEPVARALRLRRDLRAQRRIVYADTRRTPFAIGRCRLGHPCDGIVEAVVMVHSRVKSAAVAVRLESIDWRWRATELTVL